MPESAKAAFKEACGTLARHLTERGFAAAERETVFSREDGDWLHGVRVTTLARNQAGTNVVFELHATIGSRRVAALRAGFGDRLGAPAGWLGTGNVSGSFNVATADHRRSALPAAIALVEEQAERVWASFRDLDALEAQLRSGDQPYGGAGMVELMLAHGRHEAALAHGRFWLARDARVRREYDATLADLRADGWPDPMPYGNVGTALAALAFAHDLAF